MNEHEKYLNHPAVENLAIILGGPTMTTVLHLCHI